MSIICKKTGHTLLTPTEVQHRFGLRPGEILKLAAEHYEHSPMRCIDGTWWFDENDIMNLLHWAMENP